MISLLHKYGKTIAIVATQSLNDALWGLIGDFALRLFHVAILLSLWRTVMAGQGVVAGMSLEAVLTYTMVAAIFADQLSGRTQIDDDLWSGNIANRFLRPMGIYGQMLAEMVGGWIPGLLFFALPLLLIAPLLGVDPLPATWEGRAVVPAQFGAGRGSGHGVGSVLCRVHGLLGAQRVRAATDSHHIDGAVIGPTGAAGALAVGPRGLSRMAALCLAGVGTTANLHRHGRSTRPHPFAGNLGCSAVGWCARRSGATIAKGWCPMAVKPQPRSPGCQALAGAGLSRLHVDDPGLQVFSHQRRLRHGP